MRAKFGRRSASRTLLASTDTWSWPSSPAGSGRDARNDLLSNLDIRASPRSAFAWLRPCGFTVGDGLSAIVLRGSASSRRSPRRGGPRSTRPPGRGVRYLTSTSTGGSWASAPGPARSRPRGDRAPGASRVGDERPSARPARHADARGLSAPASRDRCPSSSSARSLGDGRRLRASRRRGRRRLDPTPNEEAHAVEHARLEPLQVEVDHRRHVQRDQLETIRPPTMTRPRARREAPSAPTPTAMGTAPATAARSS